VRVIFPVILVVFGVDEDVFDVDAGVGGEIISTIRR
jgi:hypothetical protein